MRARASGLVRVMFLVLLMGGYVMVAHGAGRMGGEHLDETTSLPWPSTGPQFLISAGTHPVGVPAMAFNPQTNRYLVVWADERSGVRELWGTLVDASGNQAPIGEYLFSQPSCFRISEGIVAGNYSVACGNDEYFVFWGVEVYEDTWVSYGKRVSRDGYPYSEASQVLSGYSESALDTRTIVYNSRDDEYLVVCGENAGRVSASGEILDAVAIPQHVGGMDVGYNSVRNEYLILYLEYIGEYPDVIAWIRAQRLSNTGIPLGHPIDISGPWAPAGGYGYAGSICYNPSVDEYLVSWGYPDHGTTEEFFSYAARRLSGDGAYVGDPIGIKSAHPLGPSVWDGPLVYNALADEYLATWNGGARRISSSGQYLGTEIPYSGDQIGYCPQVDKYLLCRRENTGVYCRYLTTDDGYAVGVERSLVGSSGHQSQLAVSYHEALDQYLVAWRDTRSDEEGDMYAQRVGADGALWESNFSLGDTYSPSFPAVAYNEQGLEWLVVWQERGGGGQSSWLRGQRVSASGDLLGDRFDVDVAYYQVDAPPSIAYNRTENQYLVVWSHTDAGELHGRRVAADGTVLGDTILIASGGFQKEPDVVYNSVSNEYLVVWEEDHQIYARIVQPDGMMYGMTYAIGDGNCYLPAIAYNPQEDQYLLVWSTDLGSPFVKMQRLSGSGTLLDGPSGLWNYDYYTYDADVAYNPTTNTYVLFCWMLPGQNLYRLEAYQVDVAGNWTGLEGWVGQGEFTGRLDSGEPSVACSSGEARCMLVWQGGRGDVSVWGSECGLSAVTPTPTPTSTTAPTGMPTATLTNTPLPTNTPTATVTNTPSAYLYLPLVFKGSS